MTERRKTVYSPQIRHRARECALQFLFGLEFTQRDWAEQIDAFWRMVQARPTVQQYAERLIEGVCSRRAELDAIIATAVENWSPTRIGHVERNILRMAVFEMRHSGDVPVNVAINEAVELAKAFGADEAPRFINGVLDRLKEG